MVVGVTTDVIGTRPVVTPRFSLLKGFSSFSM